MADSGYQDQTLAPRRADCTGEQRIVGADEADRYDADAVGSHPSERTCNGDGAAARRVAPVNVRDQQRRARGCALHLAVAHDQRSDGGAVAAGGGRALGKRSEEHTSELQSLMRISYAVFCLKKKKQTKQTTNKS